MLSSRESSWPRDWTHVSAPSALEADFLPLSHRGSHGGGSRGLGYTLRKYGGARGTSKLKYTRWVDSICQKIEIRSWKPAPCHWHSQLMVPTGGTVHYAVHWQRNSPTVSTLWGFPLSFEREMQTLATTIEPDGVFSSHEFLPISKPFQVISKQLKSKFR